ncbi:hypothetical protein FPSE_09632 [Fusarium pseudograminearum CS3096]|uniref:Uncharacterized protein n=1 Tax=Fusarium pseudograminearum (strain CS3096) TaxID=1028729 RepID=K3UEP2_FUSPC|nr:hypothetical protein FPSE_09632 [Fusarium pseudograminearum CS3096]EKJ70106.1 hypothetical protein FPSE_09632 [Fusarium pseudograminearum CS3096]
MKVVDVASLKHIPGPWGKPSSLTTKDGTLLVFESRSGYTGMIIFAKLNTNGSGSEDDGIGTAWGL